MRKLLLLLMLAVSTLLQAQTDGDDKKSSCSCGFSTINQLGILEGGSASAFHVQSINGFRYKTWFAGIGVGLDYYKIRGIPLFLDVRKSLLNKMNTPFVYADGGIHFGWGRDGDKHSSSDSKFNNSPYVDAGLGYRVGLGNTTAFVFSAGYSYKYVKETISYFGGCGWGGCQEYFESYRHYLNRISIKAGLQF